MMRSPPALEPRGSPILVSNTIELRFTGRYALAASFDLAAKASFVAGLPRKRRDKEAAVYHLAFALEGISSPLGVRISQHDGRVHANVAFNPGGAASDDVRTQLERILCLDSDGAGFDVIGACDDVVAGLQSCHPGLRPVLFPSPYEAAMRAIIGYRLPVHQAAAVTALIAEDHGVRVGFRDRIVHAFPAPDRLSELPMVRGLANRKVEQLRALGTAAADGRFASRRLRAMGRAMAAAYHLGEDQGIDTLERIADRWRPYR